MPIHGRDPRDPLEHQSPRPALRVTICQGAPDGDRTLKTLANILWLVFAGIWLFLGYVVAAVLNAIFIITIPFAIQSLKLATFVIWPFGRTVVHRPGASSAASGCGNVIWFIFGGWYMALIHVLTGLLLCIPIITIPFAVQNFKLAALAVAPFGKEIVSNEEAQRRRAHYQAGAARGWQVPPPTAQLSPDGQTWWDGSAWQPAPSPPPLASGSPPALPPPPGNDIAF